MWIGTKSVGHDDGFAQMSMSASSWLFSGSELVEENSLDVRLMKFCHQNS